MISALKKLFEAPPGESEEERQQRLRLAAAALLIETARADFTQGADEQAVLETLLCDSLGLTIETISRQLTRMRSDDLLDLPSRREIVIKDRPAMMAMAG